MNLIKHILKSILPAIMLLCGVSASAQTMMPIPAHASLYTSSIRGYWFTAPCDFVITGLRVPSEAGTGTQNIQVIKILDATPVVYSVTSTNFTSLHITFGATNGVIQNVNIPVTAGEKIAILGSAGTSNSYGTVSGTTNIDGNTVTLARMGYQGNLGSTGIPNYWTEPASSSISRTEMYYTTCSTKVTQDPVSKTICENQQAIFSANSVDANVFKWQANEGSGFFDVTNNGHYSGATTSTLSVNNTPFSFDNNTYRCLVYKGSTSSSCADTTADATLNVNGLVNLSDLPANDTTCINSTKDIELKGTGSISNYKWQKYDVISGSYYDLPAAPPYTHMGNILRISNVPDTLDGAKFRCIVNGVCDNRNSTETILAVNLVPKVSVPPADINADPGDDVIFEVTATAPGALYQWQVAAPDTFVYINDGGIYSGVKTSKLTVKGVSRVQNEFKFRCLVSSSPGICNTPSDTSNFGILTVNPSVSVSVLEKGKDILIFPNPAKDNIISIKTPGIKDNTHYNITDRAGRNILSGTMNYSVQVDISSIPAGVYIVELTNELNQPITTSRFTKL